MSTEVIIVSILAAAIVAAGFWFLWDQRRRP